MMRELGSNFWDYLSDFLPLLSHSPPWLWWSRFSMIVWSITSPQVKHRQLKKGPFGAENSSWIIIPLHRSHFILSSRKLSLWDHEDLNKVSAVFYWKKYNCYNLLSLLGPSAVFKNHWEPWGWNLGDVRAERAWGAISTLVGASDDRMGEAETLAGEVSISATYRLFPTPQKKRGFDFHIFTSETWFLTDDPLPISPRNL